MAAHLPHTSHGEVACPDPSMHEKQNKLSAQASTAALYVTHPERNTSTRGAAPKGDILTPEGRLSAKSAATSLKYARAQDLPSFPTVGINNTADSAGKAALLAKDYKMKELWHPEMSSAGSQAALIAARGGGKLDLWQPSATKEGNSAATLAMRTKGLSPQVDYGYTADGKQRALQAATLSVRRERSGSTPVPVAHPAYPDSHNSAHNALNAATVSHRANSVKAAPDGWESEANQAARIKNLNKKIDPEMFGDHPPWKDDEEDKHQAALRASAVSMAKQMYEYKNRTALGSDLTGGVAGAEAAAARQAPSSQVDIKQEAMRYIHLQDAAHKLAQERLAKIDRNFEAGRYREYYGYPDNKTTEAPPRKQMHRLSVRGRGHKRATSEGGELDDSDDEEQARRIRGQMSQLGSNLNNVDEKKRSDDRAKLLAAAEKRVHARMHDMDEKVFADTGKVTPAMMEEWEAKARKRQQEEKEQAAQHPGMTHIGGGKFISQSEIEAIAAARLKPTLDEISATAEKRRARDEELRQEREYNEREKREGKQKDRAEKEDAKRVKNEEKAAARREKDEVRVRKEEEKRIAKDDKRKSREHKREDVGEAGNAAAAGAATQATVGGHSGVPSDKAEKKRDGTLGRWASKLRRNKRPEGSTEVEEKPEPGHETGSVGTAVAGGAAGTAGVVAVADGAHEEHADASDHEVSDLEDDDDQFRDMEDAPAGGESVVAPSLDDAPVASGKALKPNLERHISTIAHSDDEDSDDIGSDDEDENGTLGSDRAQETARRVLSAPEDGWAGTESKTEATIAGGVGATSLATTDHSETEPASRSIWTHDSGLTNIVDPRAQPDSHAVEAPEGPVVPASTTQSDPPVSKTATAPSGSTSSAATHAEAEDTNKGGLVGLFNRFRGGNKKREQQAPKPAEPQEKFSPEAPRTSAVGDESTLATSTTERPSEDVLNVPDSPSSFARGEGGLKDLDDASSSGLEEEDLGRGRVGGRLAGTFMSLGKTSGTPLTGGKGLEKQRTNDDDQFEEARDHFDESLAPPPAFAGQAKSESPVRGTRFREEV